MGLLAAGNESAAQPAAGSTQQALPTAAPATGGSTSVSATQCKNDNSSISGSTPVSASPGKSGSSSTSGSTAVSASPGKSGSSSPCGSQSTDAAASAETKPLQKNGSVISAENAKAAPALIEQLKPAADTAQIIVVPFMTAGSACSLSVVDGQGKPLPSAGVYFDEQLFSTDSAGQLAFEAPDQNSFELAILADGKRKIGKRKFSRNVKGIFAESEGTAEMAALLLRESSARGDSPQLIYTPAAVSPGSRFLLIGNNFSAKISEDRVNIDGLDAPVLSASRQAIVATVPDRLKEGPLRDIFVFTNGQVSNSAEIDLASPFFSYAKVEGEEDEAAPESGSIGVTGSNLPCLVHVRNLEPDSVSLWSPKQEPLGKNNVLLSPGGVQNFLNIKVRRLSPGAQAKIDLSLEQLIPLSAEALPVPQLQNALCRAEIIRLARRKSAAELQLEEMRRKENAGASPAMEHSQEEPLQQTKPEQKESPARNEERSTALSLRIIRLSRMLASRRDIFECFGNNDILYRQALDDAAGGAMVSLDASVKPVQIISDGGVGLAANSPQNEKPTRRGRPLRMLEPVIRLLPPMDEAQLAAFNAMKISGGSGTQPATGNNSKAGNETSAINSRAAINDERSGKSALPGSDSISGSSPLPGNAAIQKGIISSGEAANNSGASADLPQLRPSLPEPEPEVSADSRGKLSVGSAKDKNSKGITAETKNNSAAAKVPEETEQKKKPAATKKPDSKDSEKKSAAARETNSRQKNGASPAAKSGNKKTQKPAASKTESRSNHSSAGKGSRTGEKEFARRGKNARSKKQQSSAARTNLPSRHKRPRSG